MGNMGQEGILGKEGHVGIVAEVLDIGEVNSWEVVDV